MLGWINKQLHKLMFDIGSKFRMVSTPYSGLGDMVMHWNSILNLSVKFHLKTLF